MARNGSNLGTCRTTIIEVKKLIDLDISDKHWVIIPYSDENYNHKLETNF